MPQRGDIVDFALIKPFAYDDPETGDRIEVAVSPRYSKILVNGRTYFFVRETGEFDGTASPELVRGPVLISDAE